MPRRFEFCGLDAKHGHGLAAARDSAAAPRAAADPPVPASQPVSETSAQPPAPSSQAVSEEATGREQDGGAGQSERRALLAVEREKIYSRRARRSAVLVHSCALVKQVQVCANRRLRGSMSTAQPKLTKAAYGWMIRALGHAAPTEHSC